MATDIDEWVLPSVFCGQQRDWISDQRSTREIHPRCPEPRGSVEGVLVRFPQEVAAGGIRERTGVDGAAQHELADDLLRGGLERPIGGRGGTGADAMTPAARVPRGEVQNPLAVTL